MAFACAELWYNQCIKQTLEREMTFYGTGISIWHIRSILVGIICNFVCVGQKQIPQLLSAVYRDLRDVPAACLAVAESESVCHSVRVCNHHRLDDGTVFPDYQWHCNGQKRREKLISHAVPGTGTGDIDW